MYEMIWKEMTTIDIVYHNNPNNCVKINGKSYPKAYIVNHDDKKAMESARSWAKGYPYNNDKSPTPKIVTTKNSDFTLQIVKAADSSFRSGKLAFWMCVFEKEGIEPFATGINSELLCLLIRQSTLINGYLQDKKIFFARCNGQLGILHENMDAYQEYKKIQARRNSVSKNKTTKWQVGNVYTTVTLRDVMMGELVMPLRPNMHFNAKQQTTVCTIDFNSKPRKIFSSEKIGLRTYAAGLSFENGIEPDQLNNFEACLAAGLHDPHDKCPSRHCEGQASFSFDDYDQKLIASLEKICALACDKLPSQLSRYHYLGDWIELAAFHLTLCELSPTHGLNALKQFEKTIHTCTPYLTPKPGFPYKIVHMGQTEHTNSQLTVIKRIIEIAREHYEQFI